MKRLLALFQKYQEGISYLFFGGLTTVVSWGSYAVFIKALHFALTGDLLITVANSLSWCCAMLFAFVTNKLWVFHSRSWKRKIWIGEFLKFASARVLTGILEIVGVPFAVSMGLNQTIAGVEGMIAKILISILVVIINYFFSKFLIFRS